MVERFDVFLVNLDDADRVPVDVVVDEEVAVLEILPLADDIGPDEDVQLGGLLGHGEVPLLGSR